MNSECNYDISNNTQHANNEINRVGNAVTDNNANGKNLWAVNDPKTDRNSSVLKENFKYAVAKEKSKSCKDCSSNGNACFENIFDQIKKNPNSNLEGIDLDQVASPVPTNVVVPPDGGWGWVVVAASFCCNLVVDGIIFSFGIMLTKISEAFNETEAKVSLVGSLLSGTYLIVGPFASALANRYGFRLVTIIGSIISSLAFIISSYSTSIEFLCLTYGIIGGIGFGLIFVPSVITIGFYFEKWRALATGIAVCGSGIGTFLISRLSAILIETIDWRGTLIIHAGLLLNCAVCGALFRPLNQIMVDVPISGDQEEEEDLTNKLPILQTKVARSLLDKSESRLNIYEDLGITVDNSNDIKHLFNNNNKYPTASQILCSSKRASYAECCKKSSQSLDNTPSLSFFNHHSNTVTTSEKQLNKPNADIKNMNLIANKQNEEADWTDKSKIVNGYDISNGNTWIPDIGKILISRNHSMRSAYKSQSFTEHSPRIQPRSMSIRSRRNTVSRTDFGNRPLYRDDIFFNANLKRLPQYTSKASGMDYTMSVTRLPTYTDVMEEQKVKCSLCPEAVRRALGTMLDISLLKSVTFMLLAFSGFTTSMGLYVPYIYINERAKLEGIDYALATWLISIVGIANTIGRVGFGVLSSIPSMDALILNNVALSICGISTILSGLSSTFVFQFSYAMIFGLTIACFSTLRTIIVVDLLGLEKLTNAFGLLLLFQGIAAVIGPPLAGHFVDVTRSHTKSFYLSGVLILASAIMCYPIGKINKWEKEHWKQKDKPEVNV